MTKVLVLNIGGIGDMVMATPALAALASRVDPGRFDLLTVRRSAPIVGKAPFVGDIFTVDVSLLTGSFTVTGFFRLIASFFTLVRLRLRSYDITVDLMAMESKSAARKRKLLIDIIAPNRRAGRDTNGWADWLDVKAAEQLAGSVHEVIRKLSVLGSLNLAGNAPEMTVYSTDSDADAARTWMRSMRGGTSAGVAILVPGAWRPTRRWDKDRFIRMGKYLKERYGCAVAVCGSREERKIVTAVANGIPGSHILMNIPPRVLFEIFRHCAIMITNDTGPMHLAAAARLPRIVAIFGPENPDRYAPEIKGSAVIVVSRGVDCSPCTRYRCDDMRCLAGIGVKKVKEAVDLLMAGGEAAGPT